MSIRKKLIGLTVLAGLLAALLAVASTAGAIGHSELTLAKTSDLIDNDFSGDLSVGDVINYTITATNTGTGILTNVTVTDDFLALTCDDEPPNGLGENAAITCTGSHTVLPEENGTAITNVATAVSSQTATVEARVDNWVFFHGQLILTLTGTESFTFEAGGTTVDTQPITATRCQVDSPTDFVSVDGLNTEKIGLLNHGFGIKAKGSGTDCGLVDFGDGTVVIALAGDLAAKEFDSLAMDMEGKGLVTIQAQLLNDGASVGYFCATTDESVVEETFDCDEDPSTVDSTEFRGLGADSGPDARDGDNFRWIIEDFGVADELRLTVHPDSDKSSGFSLKGGGDGGDVEPTVFSIIDDIDGVLACGDTVRETEGALEGTFTRIDDSGSGGTCALKPYSLVIDALGETISFTPEGELATYSAILTKSPDLSGTVPSVPILEYDDFTFGGGFRDMLT